jgi:hypothetical protein
MYSIGAVVVAVDNITVNLTKQLSVVLVVAVAVLYGTVNLVGLLPKLPVSVADKHLMMDNLQAQAATAAALREQIQAVEVVVQTTETLPTAVAAQA